MHVLLMCQRSIKTFKRCFTLKWFITSLYVANLTSILFTGQENILSFLSIHFYTNFLSSH